MSRNPEFLELLEKMKITHDKKSADYATSDNVFSNFEYAAQLASVFTDEVDRVFATLVGIKLARICELRKGKVPNNESLDDSFLDLANYCAIWGSRVMKLSKDQPLIPEIAKSPSENELPSALRNESAPKKKAKYKTENLDEACGRCGHKNAHHIDLTKEVLTYVPCKYITFNGGDGNNCGCR